MGILNRLSYHSDLPKSFTSVVFAPTILPVADLKGVRLGLVPQRHRLHHPHVLQAHPPLLLLLGRVSPVKVGQVGPRQDEPPLSECSL